MECAFSQPVGATSVVIQQSIDGGFTWSTSNINYTNYGDDKILDQNDTRVQVDLLQPNTTYMFKLVVTGGGRAGDSNIVTETTMP